MSAQKNAPADEHEPTRGSATPFLIALGIAVLVIGGILSWNALRPGEERIPDSGQIAIVVGQYYGALNNGRYADFVANTCAKDRAADGFPQEAGFADARREAVEQAGAVEIEQDGISNVVINGDTATADLTLRYPDRPEQSEQARFVREGGEWKKCS